jgi:hypothetical protein
MDSKDRVVVVASLAMLATIPLFFTDAFYGAFTGRDAEARMDPAQHCEAFAECVEECAERGPSEAYCTTDFCAPQAEFGPEVVFACQEPFLDQGPS